jgi:hypothetical protein
MPDLTVRDASDFGGCVAAEVLGIPHVAHQGAAFLQWMLALQADPLAEMRATYGLPPDPELCMLERYLVLSPPGLEGANSLQRPTLHAYRAMPFDRSGDEQAPEWPLPVPEAPLVYATGSELTVTPVREVLQLISTRSCTCAQQLQTRERPATSPPTSGRPRAHNRSCARSVLARSSTRPREC